MSLRLRVKPEDEVGLCVGCRWSLIIRSDAGLIKHCFEMTGGRDTRIVGRVLECNKYSPMGAKRLRADVDSIEEPPRIIDNRTWWEDNTYL